MTPDSDAIMQSLEQAAQAHGDPAQVIYDTLFSRHPDLEALFILDTDASVRASMLAYAFDCIIDYCGEGRYALNFIAASRGHHRGYGVPDHLFDVFFEVIRDTVKSILGAAWSAPMDRAWAHMLERFARQTTP